MENSVGSIYVLHVLRWLPRSVQESGNHLIPLNDFPFFIIAVQPLWKFIVPYAVSKIRLYQPKGLFDPSIDLVNIWSILSP
jgi:hypothetical protein